jgi:hypothetical protein
MINSAFKLFFKKFNTAWKLTPKPIRNIVITFLAIIFLLLSLLGAIFPLIPGSFFLFIALTLLASEFSWAESYKVKLINLFNFLKTLIIKKFKKPNNNF